MRKMKRYQLGIEPIYDPDFYNSHTRLIKIPPTAKERCDQGIVKYIGANCDPVFTIGMHVIFSGYSGTTIAIDNEIIIHINYEFVKASVHANYNVPGLYFKDKDGNYFQANYEKAITFLSLAYNDFISPHIDVKVEEHKTQRDEIDRRNL